MSTFKLPEPYRKLARAARKAGWQITRRPGGPLAWTSPSGKVVFTPGSPSDRRGIRHDTARLRRAGLAVR